MTRALREAARARGEPFYRTDKPCQRGHADNRYVSSGNCVTCMLGHDGSARKRPTVDNEKKRLRIEKWKRDNPGYRRNWTLKRYGLTQESYLDLLDAQEHRCAICRRDLETGQSTHVDHCHNSGRVRGVLCRGCNTALGSMCDDPDRLESAAAYLRRHT